MRGNPLQRVDREMLRLIEDLSEEWGIKRHHIVNTAIIYGTFYLMNLEDKGAIKKAVKESSVLKGYLMLKSKIAKETHDSMRKSFSEVVKT